MELPEYWIKLTNLEISDNVKMYFDSILEEVIKSGKNHVIEYSSSIPKWKFLSYITKQCPYVLHGSGNTNIEIIEPRQSNDIIEFGNQKAIYATTDGIWPIFFAILDRTKSLTSICNECIYLRGENGILIGPFYFFSVNKKALYQKPWKTGTIYLLSKDTFQTQPDETIKGNKVYIPQLASLEAVKPVAKIQVEPEDFPFLNLVRGINENDFEKCGIALSRGEPLP